MGRLIVRMLDRPGGRWLLTLLARVRTGVQVQYIGRWMRRLPDGFVLVDLPHFRYYASTLRKTADEVRLTEAAARDYWFYEYSPQPGDTIVDIGAGSGIETRVFAEAVGPNGRVYAIEAHPDTYARLALAIEKNRWQNVVPIFGAIVADGQSTVYIDDQPQDVSNAVAVEAGDRFRHAVPGISLDALCLQYAIGRIDFLKMNIEGAERFAIEGMSRSIAITRHVCIACHDHRAERGEGDFFATKAPVTAFLHKHGFRTRTREDQPHPFARGHVYALREETPHSSVQS